MVDPMMMAAIGQEEEQEPAAPPALGSMPALQRFTTPSPSSLMSRPSMPPVQEMPGYVNPRRALWGGFLNDMANHFLSGRQAGIGGLGPQSMFGAIQNNQQLEQRRRDQMMQRLQEMMLRRQITQPVLSQAGAATFDPDTGSWSVTAGAGDESGGTSAQQNLETYNRLLAAGHPLADEFARSAGLIKDERGVVGGVQRLANGNLGLVMGDGSVQDLGVPFYNEAEVQRLREAEDEITGLYESAFTARELADRFAQQAPDMNAGMFGSAGEMIKSALGTEDSVSLLRTQYREFRNNQVLQSLPPGPASDRDISIFLGGFPADTAGPEYVAQWLRGRAKLQEAQARVQEHRLQYFANGGKRSEWPAEMRRFLKGLEGTLFEPEYDDIGEGFEMIPPDGDN